MAKKKSVLEKAIESAEEFVRPKKKATSSVGDHMEKTYQQKSDENMKKIKSDLIAKKKHRQQADKERKLKLKNNG